MPKTGEQVFVARQPIFDREHALWGHELFFRRSGDDTCAFILDPDAATAAVVADGLAIAAKGLPEGKRICLNLSLRSVLDHVPEALPASLVVLEVSVETALALDPGIWRELKDKGFALALNDYRGQEGLDPLLKVADLVKVHFAAQSSDQVMAVRSRLKGVGASLAASQIEDWTAYEGARALGFDLFQGFYFAAPQMVSGHKMSTSQDSRLRLVKALAEEQSEVAELSGIISADPGLSHRLLRYINTPGFGLSSEVSSIAHASSLLGIRPLRSWAMVVVMADMDCSEKGKEVSWFALHRAVFLKLAALNGLAPGLDPESMFLLGLFSNLDALLGVTMDKALEGLPLAGWMEDALLRNEGRGAAWLALLEDLESGRLGMVREGLGRLDIRPSRASSLYMEATRQAAAVLSG